MRPYMKRVKQKSLSDNQQEQTIEKVVTTLAQTFFYEQRKGVNADEVETSGWVNDKRTRESELVQSAVCARSPAEEET